MKATNRKTGRRMVSPKITGLKKPNKNSRFVIAGIQMMAVVSLIHVASAHAADGYSADGYSADATASPSNGTTKNGDTSQYGSTTSDSALVPTVKVTAAPPASDTQPAPRGALGSRSDLETPFSTVTADNEKIEERQVKAMNQLFVDDAAVVAKGSTYTQGAFQLNIRGIPLDISNSYKINGQPFQMQGVEMPLELFQAVDVLKGATAFLYGFGTPGGVVNYVTKKPTEDFTFSFDAGFSSDGIYSQHFDVGDTIGASKNLGYRLNFAHEAGDTYNGVQLDRTAAGLSLGAKLTSDLTVNANLLYQERDIHGSVPGGFNTSLYPVNSPLPSPVSGSKNLSSYEDAYYNSTIYGITTDAHYHINDAWHVDVDYGHTVKIIDTSYETPYLLSPNGDYQDRLTLFFSPKLIFDNIQASLEGNFKTGPLTHDVMIGASYMTLRRDLNTSSALPTVNTNGNLYDVPTQLPLPSVDRNDFYKFGTWNTSAEFLSDTINFARYWSVLAGIRYIDYRNDNYTTTSQLSNIYDKTAATPSFAIMFKPRSDITIYTSYIQGLEDGGTVGTQYANANETLKPTKSEQYEFGIKRDGALLGASAAVFQIDRGVGYADYSTDPLGIYTNDGEGRYRGIDASVHSDLTNNLTGTLSATWLNATYQQAATAIVGNNIEGVPNFTAAVSLSERLPWVQGLTIHADTQYNGPEWVNSANNWELSSFTLFNLGGSYVVPIAKKDVTFRAEVNNVFNKDHWFATYTGNTIQIGAPRLFSLSARVDL